MDEAIPSWERMYADERYAWFWPPAYEPESDRPEPAAVFALLDGRPGQRLLDLACGRGWLTIPLALSGYQVTGFDLSQAMLERARAAADQAGAAVQWVRGDMRQLPAEWTASFDHVTFTLSEFGCFSDPADNQQVLEEVARVLRPGGRFILDVVVNRDGLVQQDETINYLEGDGFFVIETDSFNLLSGVQRRDYRWYDRGRLHETQWQAQVYSPPEVRRMLEQAGFQILGAFGSLKGEALTRTSTGMTFLAQRGG
jgi:ubiquinone/menaquinone biosynthesis C-methylase UbiE